jgi:K+-transporting ATPase A subunit
VVLFSTVSFVVVYALLRFQVLLPLNPAGLGPVAPTWPTTRRSAS